MEEAEKNKKIRQNVIALFFRMFVTLIISFYSVRLLLGILGVESFGVYTIVAGFVSSLSFLSQSMSISVQRFYSFALGKKNQQQLKNIFGLSFIIFLMIAVFTLILGETIGYWFVSTKIVIPKETYNQAIWLYHFSLFSFVFLIFRIPYMAILMAYEDMKTFAALNILENSLKLLAVIILPFLAEDLLYHYGVLLLIISITTLFIYVYITKQKFKIAKFHLFYEKKLFNEMLSFSGWSFFGVLAGLVNNQGNNILLNIFFGPIVNAAREVAFQVQNAVISFSNSIYIAFKPQLIKSYAERNNEYLMSLFYLSNKAIFFINTLICVPIMINTKTLLNLWLGEVTKDMVVFSQLSLIYIFIFALNNPITTIIQATGNIKKYFVYTETFIMLSLPLTYLFFLFGFPPKTTFIISIVIFMFAHLIRLRALKIQVGFFKIKKYMLIFILPASLFICSVCAVFYTYKITELFKGEPEIIILVFESVFVTVLSVLFGYLFMLSNKEKQQLTQLIKNNKQL